MRRSTTIALLVLGAAACGVSTQQEVQLGMQEAQQVNQQLPVVADAEINRYINVLGDSIARLTSRADLEWHFAVVNTNVINAFALPGGYVYVNRGVIERADRLDELAGVMGHEIGHVVLRHSVKQMEQMQTANIGVGLACVLTNVCQSGLGQAAINVGGTLVFAKFSREDEKQADEDGFRNVMRAGISPKGMVTFFGKLLQEEQSQGANSQGANSWFTDHPLTQDRITDIQNLISRTDPAIINSLSEDTQGFHAFKQRVHALPAPPPTQKGQ